MRYYKDAISQYVNFQGIANRKEFWMFVLWNFLITTVLGWVSSLLLNDATWPLKLYSVFIFLPSWAIVSRRLHDSGRSSWWIFINLIPGIGQIILVILMLMPSKY